MNRFFIAFNFLGIIVLAVLCAAQWQINSRVTAHARLLELTVEQQRSKLDDDAKTIKTYTSDLEDFRQRLALSEQQLKELDEKLSHEINDRNAIAAERDDLKIALGKWMAAVADRDKTINQARDQLHKLADDRNDAVQKLNDLTDKYNALVKQWNDQQSKH
jgi:chromosome segregation ATPase